jgi:hypothetical protein
MIMSESRRVRIKPLRNQSDERAALGSSNRFTFFSSLRFAILWFQSHYRPAVLHNIVLYRQSPDLPTLTAWHALRHVRFR